MLDIERQYHDKHRDEWLSKYPGKVVLVRGEDLIGLFDSLDEAMSEGARQFGLSPFLVRYVEESEQTVSIPALSLGLLRADTTRSA